MWAFKWGESTCHLRVECGSPKLNVLCIKKTAVCSSLKNKLFILRCLATPTNFFIQHLATESNNYHFQQDEALPHWYLTFWTLLNEHLPNRWIGCTGKNNWVFCMGVSISLVLTSCNVFFWGYVKDLIHVPQLPVIEWASWIHQCHFKYDLCGSAHLVSARIYWCVSSNRRDKYKVYLMPHEMEFIQL